MIAQLADVDLLELVRRVPQTRRLYLTEWLTPRVGSQLRHDLVSRQREGSGDILLTINSMGGNYDAGMRLYHSLRTSTQRVIGLVDGEALSIPFMVLQGCQVRVATPRSKLLIHNPWGKNTDPPKIHHDTDEADFLLQQQIWLRTFKAKLNMERDETIEIILGRSNFGDRSKVESFLAQDVAINVEKAENLGFIDGVI